MATQKEQLPATQAEPEAAANRDAANQLIGRIQMSGAIGEFLTTVGTFQLREIKETKAYRALKGQKGMDRQGNEITDVGTWGGFCKAIGSSQQKVDEDISNLNTFGQEALEKMHQIGIGYREMRQLRQLPEAQLEEIQGRMVDTADKDAVMELVEDVISAKQAAEREAKELEDALAKERVTHEETLWAKEDLQEELKKRQAASWPEFVQELRMESSALTDKGLLCLDDLDRLVGRIGAGELLDLPDGPDKAAHMEAAAMALWTNLQGMTARFHQLMGHAQEALTPYLSDAPEALPLMGDEEVKRLLVNRETMVGEHKAEALAREAKRMEGKPRGRGRPKGSRNKGAGK